MIQVVLAAQTLATIVVAALLVADTALAPLNCTGVWRVQAEGNPSMTGTVHLTQHGTTVIGYYGADAKGEISGTMVGDQLNGTWYDAPDGTGWITFRFQPTNKAFSGAWGYNGKKPTGDVIGTRAR